MNVRDLVPWGRSDRDLPAPMTTTGASHPILSLHREMNRLFDDVFRGFDVPLARMGRMAGPDLDVEETDSEYRVTAELPGLGQDDVEITCADGVLTLRGEKHGERQDRALSERWFGRFERRISLPDADDGRAEATMRDGLLTIVLPKTAQARENVRRIPINAGSAARH
jgi:HSP20 family protein